MLVLVVAETWYRTRSSFLSRHIDFVRSRPPHDVVILGDSAARQGVDPEVLRSSTGVDSVNVAILSGSGIWARRFAREVAWRPQVVVYAGVPVEVLDSHRLQPGERELVPLESLALAGKLDSATLLSRFSRLYADKHLFYPFLAGFVRSRAGSAPDSPALMSVFHESGFEAVQRVHELTADEQRAYAERKAKLWFPADAATSHIRETSLRAALDDWRSEGGVSGLIIMPISSPLRELTQDHVPRETITDGWKRVAQASDARLLDCSASMPDDALYDDAHLSASGAAEFSARIAPWLRALVARERELPTPAGCSALH